MPVTRRTSPVIPINKIIFAGLVTFSLIACNNTDKKDGHTLSGRFVNDTFLEAVPDTIPAMIPAYCFELDFIGDSVKINFGFEEATFAYKKEGDIYWIVKAMQDQDMPFTMNGDQTITLVDTAWTRSLTTSKFIKVNEDAGRTWTFETYLNKQMISGDYIVFEKGQPTTRKLSFTSDGTVVGMEPYTAYSVCYSGDCVEETYPISNNISFTTPDKKRATYAFVKKRKDNTLTLYHIEEPQKDIKGERAIKQLAFDLRQTK
jgi:hypothetical protein